MVSSQSSNHELHTQLESLNTQINEASQLPQDMSKVYNVMMAAMNLQA